MRNVPSVPSGPAPAPYSAFLRVYEPLAAFAEPERSHWQEYAAEGHAPDRLQAAAHEHLVARRALLGVPPRGLPEPAQRHALLTVVDGAPHLCPLDLQVRAWQALVAFAASLPDELVEAFVPRSAVEEAAASLEAWRASRPDARAHVQTATWQVPLRWFVPFDPAERRLLHGGEPGEPGEPHRGARAGRAGLARALVYTTEMARARRRVARALGVLRRSVEDGPLVTGVEELGRWLEAFHPHSYVELDYGGLVQLFDDEQLQADGSVADVTEALAALGAGDTADAAGAYERVTARWRAVAVLEQAS